MSLPTSISLHRFGGAFASACSFVATVAVACAPDGWRARDLRTVLTVMAVLASGGALVALVVSAFGFLGVVALAPEESGVRRRFTVALGSGGLALWCFFAGRSPWGDFAGPVLLAIGALVIIALAASLSIWTALARHAGNAQLADDLRMAFIFSIGGAVLNVVASRSESGPIMVAGALATLPGMLMVFKGLGALSNQFRFGSAWVS